MYYDTTLVVMKNRWSNPLWSDVYSLESVESVEQTGLCPVRSISYRVHTWAGPIHSISCRTNGIGPLSEWGAIKNLMFTCFRNQPLLTSAFFNFQESAA